MSIHQRGELQMNVMMIIEQMLQLFIMMGIGYFLMSKKIIDEGFNKKLNFLVITVTLPCLIIASVFGDNNTTQSTVLKVLGIGVIMYLLLPIIAYIVVKVLRINKSKQGLFMFMTVYGNTGFMGYPIMASLFGSTGVLYAAIINMIYNISLFTCGLYLMGQDSEGKISFSYKNLLSPGIISSVLALFLYFFQIPLPGLVVGVLNQVGDMTIPLAMILIGASLTAVSMKEIFGDLTLYPYTFVRQLIIPLLAYPIIIYISSDPIIQGVLLLFTAMPVGNVAVMFSIEYEGDFVTASKAVLFTTVVSIVTVPMIASLL